MPRGLWAHTTIVLLPAQAVHADPHLVHAWNWMRKEARNPPCSAATLHRHQLHLHACPVGRAPRRTAIAPSSGHTSAFTASAARTLHLTQPSHPRPTAHNTYRGRARTTTTPSGRPHPAVMRLYLGKMEVEEGVDDGREAQMEREDVDLIYGTILE